ncbi:proteasome assembly chaperone family protein [Candidatus Woesearchaeota archaeon]|nr:proteasome assembly chaperone family protein [Candidatus Woesearchaeota archaeon]
MKIELNKKPQNVTILQGFPGFGLVGTITTEYLIDHLGDVEKIGYIWFDEMNPLIAIHEGDVVDPLGIFYSKKYNLVLLHAVTNVKGVEWKLADAVNQVSTLLKAKEVICIEGVGAMKTITGNVYYISNKNPKIWTETEAKKMNEGIVMGVTAAVLLKSKDAPLSCVFAETASNLPDSRAAAKVIKVLDKYLGLDVDYKPLLAKAEKSEDKLRGIMKQAKDAQISKEKKEVDYMG